MREGFRIEVRISGEDAEVRLAGQRWLSEEILRAEVGPLYFLARSTKQALLEALRKAAAKHGLPTRRLEALQTVHRELCAQYDLLDRQGQRMLRKVKTRIAALIPA